MTKFFFCFESLPSIICISGVFWLLLCYSSPSKKTFYNYTVSMIEWSCCDKEFQEPFAPFLLTYDLNSLMFLYLSDHQFHFLFSPSNSTHKQIIIDVYSTLFLGQPLLSNFSVSLVTFSFQCLLRRQNVPSFKSHCPGWWWVRLNDTVLLPDSNSYTHYILSS